MSSPKAAKACSDAKHRSQASGSKIKVSPVQQKILNAVKTLASPSEGESIYSTACRAKVMAMCGYTKKNCGGFNFALSIMKTKQGLLTSNSQTITLTSLGDELAEVDPSYAPGSTTEEHWEKCLAQIKGKKGKLMFEALRDGKAHARADLALISGYDGPEAGGFKFATSKLVSTGLVEYCQDSRGQPALRVTDDVFPYGRPDE